LRKLEQSMLRRKLLRLLKAKRGRKRKGIGVEGPATKIHRQTEGRTECQVISVWRAPEAPMIHNKTT
jgi:hypothetical protein